MKIDITYPPPRKEMRLRERLIKALRWPFIFAFYICGVLNIFTGGKPWSLIVGWSLWIVWSNAVATALVENNRISRSIKAVTDCCLLLLLIDILLSPGWAAEVVPIVCFSGLAAGGLLFFTDLDRQKQNLFPLLMMAGGAVVCAVVGLSLWHEQDNWTMAVMGALALALLAGVGVALGGDFLRELKKRFHVK